MIPNSLFSLSIAKQTSKKTTRLDQKQEKKKIVPIDFNSVHNAVNARLKTSKNKHLCDLILNFSRSELSQSENIIFDERDTKESNEDLVCSLERKIYHL